MDKIGIFGVPRSGTSWLAHIFNSHPDVALRFQPLFSYGHKGSLSEFSSEDDILVFFKNIFNSQDPFALMTSESQQNYPTFKKSNKLTHIVFKETQYLNLIKNILDKSKDVKIIGIVRNPLAVMASWVKAPKEFNPEWDFLREWRGAPGKNKNKPEMYYGFDQWRRAAKLFFQFEKLFPKQFLLINYKGLNCSTVDTVSKIFEFCNLKMCDQVHNFIRESKSRHDPDPYSVFRANANDDSWKKTLPDNVVNEILTEMKNTQLENLFNK